MIIIGSTAAKQLYPYEFREPLDLDIIEKDKPPKGYPKDKMDDWNNFVSTNLGEYYARLFK